MEHKVVILGAQACGKTSLLERYIRGTFSEAEYQCSIGAAFATKKVEVGGKSVIMGIWDTAGSERYESMTRIYYRGAAAAVVCFDLSEQKSFERARYWVNQLKSCEENCKVYLCGTKLDLVQGDKWKHDNMQHLARKYAAELETRCIETSAATGENVEYLFQLVAESLIEAKERQTSHIPPMVLEVGSRDKNNSSGCNNC